MTEKGHGFPPAAEDPVFFHTPPQFERQADEVVQIQEELVEGLHRRCVSGDLSSRCADNPRVTVMTAAMCQGNKLEQVRDAVPDRFFDTGICEIHAVAFAAGQAKAGMRPIVDIYSTFLQRVYDQIFQEVALQNLPVTFMLDRGGLTGPDGPTHHGVFDIGLHAGVPEHGRHGAGDEQDLSQMLDLALRHDGPSRFAIPRARCRRSPPSGTPVEFGKSEVFRWGDDGVIVCCGALLPDCLKAADLLRRRRASTSASSTPDSSSRSIAKSSCGRFANAASSSRSRKLRSWAALARRCWKLRPMLG